MALALQTVWPAHIPEDLWSFDALNPEDLPVFPVMGFSFDYNFLIAFCIGLAVILLFGWRRFDTMSYDESTYSYRVIKELAPRELRGSRTMRRSYMLYALGLVLIFTGLTFFGEFILTISAPVLNVAGVKPDFSGLNFDTYEWPLLLAFGFAGFTPLLPPLVAFEGWLRRRAHKAVGLPVRIGERTLDLLDQIDPERADDAPEDLGPGTVQTWVKTHIMETDSLPAVFRLRDELELLLRWSNVRGGRWPDENVRHELYRLERDEATEAAAALQEFEEILTRNYDEAPPSNLVRKSRTEQDPLQTHRKLLETNLTASINRLRRLRGEMAAILAVYAERDTDYSKIAQPYLRTLLTETFSTAPIRSGPERGLLLMLPFVFVAYVATVALQIHPLIGAVKTTLLSVLVTAAMETARWFVLLVLPAIVVFSVRYILMDNQKTQWTPLGGDGPRPRALAQWFWLQVLALIISGLAMAVLAFSWVALVSVSPTTARETLFEAELPVFWFFFSQIVFVPLHVSFMLLAADLPADRRRVNRLWLTTFSILNAVAMVSLMYFHLSFWFQPFGGIYCPAAEWSPAWLGGMPLPSALCININGGMDFLLYALAAMLAAGPFIKLDHTALQPQAEPDADTDGAPAGPLVGTAALLGGLVLAGALALSGPAEGQTGRQIAEDATIAFAPPAVHRADRLCDRASATDIIENSCPIVVGFREDAEPFVYKVELDSETLYIGYLAEICYDLFAGSRYRVLSVPITASNRFDLLRRAGDPPFDPGRPVRMPDYDPAHTRDADGRLKGHQPVDVLCDPTTVRFSRAEQAVDGLYSPIVFVSGVSYMRRTQAKSVAGDVYLAYVANTTAAEVATWACKRNTFRINGFSGACPRQPVEVVGAAPGADHPDGLIRPVSACRTTADGATTAKAGFANEGSQYRFCIADSHTELISWFCQPRGSGAAPSERVYFGDRDIILAKLEAWLNEGRSCGDVLPAVQRQQRSFTYEPYALVITPQDPRLFQHVQRRVYEFFSHRSEARGLFATYFPGQTMSDPLAYLFLLNAVSQEQLFKYSRIWGD